MDKTAKPIPSVRPVRFDRSWKSGKSPILPAVEPPCNLKKALACCGGKGYRLAKEQTKPTAAWELCSCVSGCPACFGRTRLMQGNDSRPCREPTPGVVVNLLNAARLPPHYDAATLESFSAFSGNGKAVLTEVKRWKDAFKPPGGRGLILEGPVGVGKTYLLVALAKELAEKGLSVRFSEFFMLLGEIKAGFADGKADAAQLAPLIDVDVLVIDELGKGRNNEFELTVLDQLVCGRYNRGKTIIAATNFRLKGRGYEINTPLDQDPGGGAGAFAADRYTTLEQRIGPRIYSRLREMCAFVELTGADLRRQGY
jgi:DNA replication protein DnaC